MLLHQRFLHNDRRACQGGLEFDWYGKGSSIWISPGLFRHLWSICFQLSNLGISLPGILSATGTRGLNNTAFYCIHEGEITMVHGKLFLGIARRKGKKALAERSVSFESKFAIH